MNNKGNTVKYEYKFCDKCGAKIGMKSTFCPYCGKVFKKAVTKEAGREISGD